MSEKIFNGRMQQKHDTFNRWESANFVPKAGEIIIYEADETYSLPRIKIGNETNYPKDLPFFFDPLSETELENICLSN